MIPSEIASQLYDLIETKSFADLSTKENELVRKWVSEEEYYNFHRAPELFRKAFKNDNYNRNGTARVKDNLLKRLEQNEIKTEPLRILMYPVPLYQVAASIALLIGVSMFWRFSANQQIKTQTLIVRDTLYKVKEQIREITKTDTIVVMTNHHYASKQDLFKVKSTDTIKGPELNSMISLGGSMGISHLYDTNHISGATLKEDSNFLKFCVKTF